MKNTQTLTITQPDDWHLHLRDGLALKSVLPFSAKQMARAIVMPNLETPITNVQKARSYYKEIMSYLPSDNDFKPLMTLYLTDNTTTGEIDEAAKSSQVVACKLYPAGATTHSKHGVNSVRAIYPILEQMQKLDIPLLIHGEATDDGLDIFDRERIFIDKTLVKICQNFPALRIVFEHITTKEAVDFVYQSSEKLAATITPHHLLMNRNDMFLGGISPHHFCLPILKRKTPHQEALISAATSANAKFFLGSDSAAHSKSSKESDCGCAGIFNAHAAIELYASVFEKFNALDKLEGFASFFGADFYNLSRNKCTITLEKRSWQVPSFYPLGSEKLIPFMAGQRLHWKLVK